MLVASKSANSPATASPRSSVAAQSTPFPRINAPAESDSAPTRSQPAARWFLAIIPTAWGLCGAVWKYHEDESDAGPFASRPAHALLRKIILPGLSVGELRRNLLREHPDSLEVFGDLHGNFHPEVVPDWFSQLVGHLQSYYATGLRDRTLPSAPDHMHAWSFWQPRLDWSCLTPFQRQVLELVAAIPLGQPMTYGQVAKKIARPQASRAVGAALGANPWPVLIPCHRVLGAQGKLTGFSAPGGLTAKRRMLAMEAEGGLFR